MNDGSTGLLRVDMTTGEVRVEPLREAWTLLGGRSLSARLLLEDCDPRCDPLGPENVLIFAGGVLTGTPAPTSGRLSVGAKSPLTGGIKEANAGGEPAQHLARLGIRAVVVTGQPADPEARFGLEIDEEGARLVEANDLKGLWTYATCERLTERYSEKASFICCGPAGEHRLAGASVACTDQDNRYPARQASRGGMGAVMGSKGLKFVAIEPGRSRLRRAAQHTAFVDRAKRIGQAYRQGDQLFAEGTAVGVLLANSIHSLPYKNRIAGQSPDAETLDGHLIKETFAERGGGMHNCLTGCIVQCSNVIHNADGEYKTSALEFETMALLGANCAVERWEDVADLDRLCDEVGLDTIETGAAIAILMEAGRMAWGDVASMKALFEDIHEGTELGRAIGSGAVATARLTGHTRVPVVKGQAIAAWDPRPLKATGVTYAAGPMGADHTAGLVVNPGLGPDEYAQASQECQIVNMVCDSSGFCQFISPTLTLMAIYYSLLYGEDVTPEQLGDQGWECLEDEWKFNSAAGWKDEDNGLSECLVDEGIGPDNAMKFDVSLDIINQSKVRFAPRPELYTARASG